MNEVQVKKYIIITKRNKPIAKLTPIEEDKKSSLFGRMKGTGQIKGDIVQSIGEDWNSCL